MGWNVINIVYIVLNDKSIGVALDILEAIQNRVRSLILQDLSKPAQEIMKEAVDNLGYGFFGLYMDNDFCALSNLTFSQLDNAIYKLKILYTGNYHKLLRSVPHFDFRGV